MLYTLLACETPRGRHLLFLSLAKGLPGWIPPHVCMWTEQETLVDTLYRCPSQCGGECGLWSAPMWPRIGQSRSPSVSQRSPVEGCSALKHPFKDGRNADPFQGTPDLSRLVIVSSSTCALCVPVLCLHGGQGHCVHKCRHLRRH